MEKQEDLQKIVEQADARQRIALARVGLLMAIYQEKQRMGYSADEVAIALTLDEDGSLDEDLCDRWRARIERFEAALEGGNSS